MKIQIYCRTTVVELYSFVATFTVYSLYVQRKKTVLQYPGIYMYSFLNSLQVQVRKRCAQ